MNTNDRDRHPPLPLWATRVQPGRFDPRVLHQEFWIDAQAVVRYVDELSTEHLYAIVRMLTKRSSELYAAELLDTLIQVVTAREQGAIAGEQLAHDLGITTIVDLEAAKWLETTTLLRAIRRTLRTRD